MKKLTERYNGICPKLLCKSMQKDINQELWLSSSGFFPLYETNFKLLVGDVKSDSFVLRLKLCALFLEMC